MRARARAVRARPRGPIAADRALARPPVRAEVVCSPPLLYMPQVQQSLKADYQLSAQNCWGAGNGAYTGEVSADMLVDSKVPWVILGHSERRALCGETNEVVAGKVRYAIEKGMQVMVCVGETLEQREAGTTMPTIIAQLAAVAAAVDEPMWASIVIAYEPVWAIGTGKVATPEQAQAVHLDIRAWVRAEVGEGVAAAVRIIYGGSVNGGNCRSLAQEADIDGFLVGGASLKPEFGDIINANSAVTV